MSNTRAHDWADSVMRRAHDYLNRQAFNINRPPQELLLLVRDLKAVLESEVCRRCGKDTPCQCENDE